MINLDIYVIIELYYGTDPAWDGLELAKFFNCGYQSIYNFMDKYGVPRSDPSETQIRLLKGLGVERQVVFRCPKCRTIMNFSKWISPYRYLFNCPICNSPYYPNIRYRVTKPEDIEKVKEYKKTAQHFAKMYAEAEGEEIKNKQRS